jgi:hypothetical protein
MECWEEFNKSAIPVGKYQVKATNGEELGLFIQLENAEYKVNIDFGAITAFRMLDEGIVMEGLFDEKAIIKYRERNFSNIIYKVKEGEFGKTIKNASNGLYDALGLEHYIIITMNYIIEVITQWEPNIEVLKK